MELLFAFGWLFWAVVILTLLGLATASVNEKPGWFVTVLAGGGVGLLFASGHNLIDAWTFLNAHPLAVVKWISVYIGMGVLYAVIRWFFYLRDLRHQLADFRATRQITGPLSSDQRDAFKKSISFYGSFPPRVSEHKGTIMGHLILWSFCWVELRPLTKLFNFVYSSIAGALQRMSDRMFADMA